jgi:gliding motility-associated-like protein
MPTGGTTNLGLIPAGKKGLIITSTDFSPFANNFSTLTDTLYVVFQKPGNTQGHFANYSTGTGLRALRLHQISTGTNESVTYDKALLVDQTGAHVAQDGAGVRFTVAGVATYYNDGCQAPYIPLSPNWTAPSSMCPTSPIVDLNTLVTGTSGGTWSGTGVTGSNFNPTGLSGPYVITYTVGILPCQLSEFHTLTVVSSSGATWTAPAALCQTSAYVNLNTLLAGTATTGGTWSGTGVTGNTFNPVGLNGSYNVTYTVGSSPCTATETHPIQVVSSAIATWTAPAALCQSSATINLNTLLSGTATTGGTWSGSGVTGNTFDPAGLNGNINVTYSVGTTPCNATESHNIQVVTTATATWTAPAALCQTSALVNLNTLLAGTATTGGTWSGTGVIGNTFSPTGLNGNYNITYTVGTAPCVATETHPIQVIINANASWVAPVPLCQSSSSINLNSLLAATTTTGGVWSGVGVTGNSFNPAGQSGNINVTYTVGTAPCSATESHTILVLPNYDASWNAPASICADAAPLDLAQFITGDIGGTWVGQGVVHSQFNPAGLTGSIPISYIVSGAAGCPDTVTHSIIVTPIPSATWSAPVVICKNLNTFDLNNLITGDQGGLWSGVGVSSNLLNLASVGDSLEVTYTINSSGCISTVTGMLYFSYVNADFSIAPTSGTAPLNTTTLNLSQNAVSYDWDFGNGFTSTETNPSSIYTIEGTYYVWLVATSALGCQDSTFKVVNVDESADFIPNAVTPNGDGLNDQFYPIISKIVDNYQMMIFNRWGELIFETTHQSDKWDGDYQGKNVAMGVYFYVIKYTSRSIDYYYNGTVSVIN